MLNLVFQQLFDGIDQVGSLGQDYVFQIRLVGAEGVHGSDAAHRRVELLKKFIGNARGNFRAVTLNPEHVFVGHDDAMIFSHRRRDGFPIIRRKRTKVDDLNGGAFAAKLRRGYFRAMNQRTVGDDADVRAFGNDARFTKGRRGVIRPQDIQKRLYGWR